MNKYTYINKLEHRQLYTMNRDLEKRLNKIFPDHTIKILSDLPVRYNTLITDDIRILNIFIEGNIKEYKYLHIKSFKVRYQYFYHYGKQQRFYFYTTDHKQIKSLYKYIKSYIKGVIKWNAKSIDYPKIQMK